MYRNTTDLARAIRTWIAFRDEEERAKKEKEDDVKALDVRRRRLHELETERLGLGDVCRYETRVVTEEEEIGPLGIETSEHPPAAGDGSNPIPVDDDFGAEPPHQTEIDPLDNIGPPRPTDQPNAADQIAPIVELLRTRQLEEREEADIRREEQVLLNKRLAMMEEQVQMLSKLITQREHNSASVSPQTDVAMGNAAEISAERATETEPAITGEAIHDVVVVDEEEPAELTLDARGETTAETVAIAEPADMEADVPLADDVADDPAGVSMENGTETPDGLSAELETALLTSTSGAESDDAQAPGGGTAEGFEANTLEEHEAETGAVDEDHAMEPTGMTEEIEPATEPTNMTDEAEPE